MTQFKKVIKAPTNKRIIGHICDFIETSIEEFGLDWSNDSQREAFVEVLEDCMEMLIDAKDIETYKVMCDRRNNTSQNIKDGMFNLDILFKVRNCLNTTQIKYTVDTNLYFEDPENLIDYVV